MVERTSQWSLPRKHEVLLVARRGPHQDVHAVVIDSCDDFIVRCMQDAVFLSQALIDVAQRACRSKVITQSRSVRVEEPRISAQ